MLTLKVEGMTCDGCVASVKRALSAAIPGAKVSVDLPSGEIKIDGSAEKGKAVAAIEDAGYTVTGATS
jgi:copper chaperone